MTLSQHFIFAFSSTVILNPFNNSSVLRSLGGIKVETTPTPVHDRL